MNQTHIKDTSPLAPAAPVSVPHRPHVLRGPFKTVRRDIRMILARDPAARGALEVILCYSGQHAVWSYRLTHWLWRRGWRLSARFLSQLARGLTGIEIHPGARIGDGFFIDHGMGVVIGETTEIGNDVTIYHGVTLGGTSLAHGKRHPTLGDRVVVGAGAKLLGAIVIGDDSRVGANSVVVKSVPPNSVVVGIPGQIVIRARSVAPGSAPDLHDTGLPDTLGTALRMLIARVEQLERANGDAAPHPPLQDADGSWHGEDFTI
ncbi:serine O-acetyltransferase [Paludibacterium yongneupense]|uniref:serine O-acetyltransferase n=1 Tax=Paludibacterium yongneupense TaxID=400061 RepID=UPI00040AA58E|nr:serine O-acetyltransferase [Paludibacterium yongneupense]